MKGHFSSKTRNKPKISALITSAQHGTRDYSQLIRQGKEIKASSLERKKLNCCYSQSYHHLVENPIESTKKSS